MPTPTLSLKTTPFQFAEFKPIMYQQELADKNILRDSMNKLESRRREANQTRNAYEASIKAIRDILDPSEYGTFDKEFQEISDRIGNLIELGDSGEAIRIANTAAHDMANDPKWQNKAQVKAQRDKWLQEMKQRGYDSYTMRMIEDKNQYYDDGTGKFNHVDYAQPLPLADMWNIAVSRTPTHQDTKGGTTQSSSYGFSKDEKKVNTPLTKDNAIDPNVSMLYKTQSTVGGSTSTTELKAEDIYNTFKQLAKTSEFNGALRLRFDTMQYTYLKANEILEDPNATEEQKRQAAQDKQVALDALEGENGFLIKGDLDKEEVFDKWVDKQAQDYFKTVQYKHTSVTSNTANDIDYNLGSSRSGGSKSIGQRILDYIMPSADGDSQSYTGIDTPSAGRSTNSVQVQPSGGMQNVQSV